MKTARIYLRVSTKDQDLERQEKIIKETQEQGYYIAKVYREKASGARMDRPELLRMLADLQKGDVIIAEKWNRISRLPLEQASGLVETIKSKGARLCIPDVFSLSDVSCLATGTAKIVIDALQDLLLKLTIQASHDEYITLKERQKQGIEIAKKKNKYKGRKANYKLHKLIIELRLSNNSINKTADILGCSPATVKKVWSEYKRNKNNPE